jgi:catechol 2,3-dioxygenase-like lactoylglutathione lyase family enzyme
VNLNQITITVSDIHRSIHFYQQLGLQLIVHTHDKYARFLCPTGDSTFSLHVADSPITPTGTSIYFEVDDLDATIAALLAKGINITTMPEDTSWLWRESDLYDPDGNHIIIYHAGVNRKDPPWRIK